MRRTARAVDLVLNGLITIAVLLLVAVVVRRELSSSPIGGQARHPRATPTHVLGWGKVIAAGLVLANPGAPVSVAIFEDLECPYCRSFHDSVLIPIMGRYGDSVSPVMVHFPLPIHRFAQQAAQATECAHEQAKALNFVNIVYGAQDSIGILGWGELAERAGIREADRFEQCVRGTVLHPRVTAGLELGSQLGVNATPTVLVNGLQFATPPSKKQLEFTVDSILRAYVAKRGERDESKR